MKTGRKCQVEKVVQPAESRLVRVVTQSRARLGSFPTSNVNNREASLVQGEERAAVEGERTCRIVAMKQHGLVKME